MSLLLATQITAVATTVLAFFAIITAVFAIRAFGKQSDEVVTLQEQLADQREVNKRQTAVLDLQVKELNASLEQRERDADERRQNQAAKVAAWFGHQDTSAGGPVVFQSWGAFIRNASDLPILDVRVFFHYIAEASPGGGWKPVMRGGPVEPIRVIPPLTDRFAEIPSQVRDMIDDVSDSIYVVSIEFTDAAGQRWQRDPRGALLPLT